MCLVELRAVVRHSAGLHARPASLVVQAAQRFQADLSLEASGRRANLKSLLSVLSLGVGPGTEVTLRASGADAEQAARVLHPLLESTEP